MSRTSRVPYHQNVYDLLQFESAESSEAGRMIAEHEARHGPIPASVREWYLVPDVVMLVPAPQNWNEMWQLNPGKLWWEFSNQDPPEPLPDVLQQFVTLRARPELPFVRVLIENQGVYRWWLKVNGNADPPVWCDNDYEDDPSRWSEVASSFSQFVVDRVAYFYMEEWTPVSSNGWSAQVKGARRIEKDYGNGLWCRSPAEPFAPPVIDFLIETVGEPERTPRAGNVTSYTFRPENGIIRVTADDPAMTNALSAWWIHAQTSLRLAELVRPILPFGTLRETLRADTDAARAVLEDVRS